MTGDGESASPMRENSAGLEPGSARAVDACGGVQAAVAYCLVPSHLRRTVTIALVVGTILTLVNQGDVMLAGHVSAAIALKVAANFAIPFVVSNLGLLSGRQGQDDGVGSAERGSQDPGRSR